MTDTSPTFRHQRVAARSRSVVTEQARGVPCLGPGTLRMLFTSTTTSAHSAASSAVPLSTCSSCSSRHSQMVSTWDT